MSAIAVALLLTALVLLGVGVITGPLSTSSMSRRNWIDGKLRKVTWIVCLLGAAFIIASIWVNVATA